MRAEQGVADEFHFEREDQSREVRGWFKGKTPSRAMDELLGALRERVGYVFLGGVPGVGKSALAHALAEAYAAQGGVVVCADGRNLAFGRVLTQVFDAAGLTPASEESGDAASALRALHAAVGLGRDVLLVVDSAQDLRDEALKALTLLANPWRPGRSAVQLALVARPELLDRLDGPELGSMGNLFSRRIVLRPLERTESEAYLNWKFGGASPEGPAFTGRARRRLVDLSRGVPGLLDMLAEAALASGEACGRFPVTCSMVRQAVGSLPGHAPHRLPVGKTVATAAAALLLVTAGAWWARQTLVSGLEQLASGLLGRAPVSMERLEVPWLADAPTPIWADAETERRDVLPGVAVVRPNKAYDAGYQPGHALRRVVVGPGETLLGLCREVYGRADKAALRAVLACNPAIVDPDLIEVGQVILFPPEANILADIGQSDA